MAKFYTNEKHKEIVNKGDMLKGCVNRMCVSNNIDEINRMLTASILYLTEIYNVNKERVLEELYGDKEIRELNFKNQIIEMFDKF